ncbi:50 kDa spicule matrix protein-like [Prionailurus bengalensis]|uniref:50 kDa spicule matrix protein-like n=1 Tax=Prionailurus bengalensis TaxID=37029 RepID=UPI001CA92BC2|nr:50 kDa spicule matrix protein-like [Prionailurus bengalensis]
MVVPPPPSCQPSWRAGLGLQPRGERRGWAGEGGGGSRRGADVEEQRGRSGGGGPEEAGASPVWGAETSGWNSGRGDPRAASTDPAPGPLTSVPGRITPLLTARHCGSGSRERGRGRRPRVQKPLLGRQVGCGSPGLGGAGVVEPETRVGVEGREAGVLARGSRRSRGPGRGARARGTVTAAARGLLRALSEPSPSRALSGIHQSPKNRSLWNLCPPSVRLAPESSLRPPRPLPPADISLTTWAAGQLPHRFEQSGAMKPETYKDVLLELGFNRTLTVS